MKRAVVCHQCRVKTAPNKWMRLGWSKVEYFYDDGNKWHQYTCAECQVINRLKGQATVVAMAGKEGK